MNNSFNNFLSKTDGFTIMRDYQHASRLYVDSGYARTPKFGFLYFIQININPDAIIDKQWLEQNGTKEVGLLAKKADLPKFTIATETLNQYNRKTVVQTKLSYSPISIELHDDNSNITHNLWLNYYKHYYADSNYGDGGASKITGNEVPESFRDTKYGPVDYTYGRYSRDVQVEFIKSIDLYVLHQKNFTQYTLVNPKITEWTHDSVAQSDNAKVLQNRMQISYENVIYKSGQIVPGQKPENWVPVYYDNTPSPYGIAGNPINNANTQLRRDGSTNFDIKGPNRVFGKVGGNYKPNNPLLDIAGIVAKNYINKNGLGKAGAVGYNIAGGVLGALGGSSAGKYADAPPTQDQPGILNLPGGVGINIFKGLNTSVDGKIRANPAAILFPPRGG